MRTLLNNHSCQLGIYAPTVIPVKLAPYSDTGTGIYSVSCKTALL